MPGSIPDWTNNYKGDTSITWSFRSEGAERFPVRLQTLSAVSTNKFPSFENIEQDTLIESAERTL